MLTATAMKGSSDRPPVPSAVAGLTSGNICVNCEIMGGSVGL